MTSFGTRAGLVIATCAVALLTAVSGPSRAQEDIPTAIAVFDNYDTAGEGAEGTAAHAARVEGFADLLKERLAAGGGFKVVELRCKTPPCTAGTMRPEALIGAAREAGARLLVYGGVHKMSTLIQMGKVQAIDLEQDKLILDQAFSFRGDNDEAFARAADFVARYIREATAAN